MSKSREKTQKIKTVKKRVTYKTKGREIKVVIYLKCT